MIPLSRRQMQMNLFTYKLKLFLSQLQFNYDVVLKLKQRKEAYRNLRE